MQSPLIAGIPNTYSNRNSAQFDGVNQFLSIADAAQTGLDLTTAFTWMFWVNSRFTPSRVAELALINKFNSTGNNRSYDVRFASAALNNRIDVNLCTLGTAASNISRAFTFQPVGANRWTQIAVTWDSATDGFIRLYVDTVLTGTSIATHLGGTLFNGTAPFQIGTVNGTSNPFSGMIDEVAIYNVSKDATFIANNYDKILTPEAAMVGYWRFENGSLLDLSGNNNTLTNNGGVTFPENARVLNYNLS